MFCVKCGTRLEDNAMFCMTCGCKVNEEQPTAQPVVTEAPVVEAQPVVTEAPVVEAQPVEQNSYNQRQYMYNGGFQSAQQPQAPQQMYQQPVMPQQMYNQQPVMQQAFYNTPAQPKKKSNASVAAVIFLVIAAIASVTISVGYFIKGDVGMGIMNICYFATAIVLMVYNASDKKVGGILKGSFYAIILVLNIIFAGVAAFRGAIVIFSDAKAGIDYYYAVILLLQYILFYVYLIISIIRGFMGKEKTSYATCLFGYISVLLIIAAFVIDVVSDINGLFVFKCIPIDLGLVMLITGDLFAVLRKGKKATQQ